MVLGIAYCCSSRGLRSVGVLTAAIEAPVPLHVALHFMVGSSGEAREAVPTSVRALAAFGRVALAKSFREVKESLPGSSVTLLTPAIAAYEEQSSI